jgi:hypothetical protein
MWFDIEFLEQVGRGEPVSRLVVGCAIRTEILAVSFLFPRDCEGRLAEWRSLLLMLLSRVPVAILFLSSMRAESLLGPGFGVTRLLLKLVVRRGTAIGLEVPQSRAEAALSDLNKELLPVTKVAGQPVAFVRFVETSVLNPPNRLSAAMAATTLTRECSLTTPKLDDEQPVPYLRAGAYQPSSFDIRVVAGTWDDSYVEMISTPLGEGTLKEAWADARPDATTRLIKLLTFRRMERFHQKAESSVELMQRYHEYRVYNWPKPDHSPRVTLFDAGTLVSSGRCRAVLSELRDFAIAVPERRVVSSKELLDYSKVEAHRRAVQSPSHALQLQRSAHEYLEKIPYDAPLREDYREFVRFLPPKLGATLELGSGHGHLARELSCRSDRYVCLELEPQVLRWLISREREQGVVGDIHCLPFRDGHFDSVIANNVLEHVYDPVSCLREVRRVLKPGGRLHALIPLDMRNPSHQLPEHRWKVDEIGIANALKCAGFSLIAQGIVDLYGLGVKGSFPSCNGLVAKITAQRDDTAA